MADISLNSLINPSQTTQSGNQTQSDLLVESFKKSKQPEVDVISSKKSSLEQRKNFFNNLKSKMDSLVSQIDILRASNASSKFITRNVTTSNSAIATATATSDAGIGVNSIKIDRLASNDLLISDRISIGSDKLFAVTGNDLKFTVNGKEISVNIKDGATNEEALKAIVSAVNAKTEVNVYASYIKDTSGSLRLTLTAKNTGSENKITFADGTSGILKQLGFDNISTSGNERNAINADNKKAHYKVSNSDQLDASLEINGIDVTSGSNTVQDAISGITLTLLKAQDNNELPVTLTADVNEQAVESVVNPMINAYNDILKFLKQNQTVLRGDSSVSSLFSRLRAITSQSVGSASDGNPKYLTELGFKINTDGTLSLSNKETLTNLLKDNPDKVSYLFTAADGFASKINDAMLNLTGDNGLIKARTKSLSDQIDDAATKITNLQDRINRQANSLRTEYESMLKLYLTAQNQYSLLQTTGKTSA